MTVPAVVSEDVERLQARVRELEHERKHLLAVIEILQELAGSLHIVDIMQAIARRLGEVFGLDRASIFLAERDARTARLVASFEDPSIRNYVVDLERYPELRRALTDGETVYIPEEDRGAVCISTQVGCTLSCRFCHTGTQKLVRNLGAAEIVGQFMAARDSYGEWPSPKDDKPRLLSTSSLRTERSLSSTYQQRYRYRNS